MTQAATGPSSNATVSSNRVRSPRPRAQDPVSSRAGASTDGEAFHDDLDDRRLRLAILIGGAGSLTHPSERT